MTVADTLPAMPFERSDVLDIAPAYRALQADHPIARVRTPAGDVAWLVTGYDLVRELMTHERMGRSHPDPARAPRFTSSALILGGPVGSYETQEADHRRMRLLLNRAFMLKRMNALRPHVQELVDGLLAELAATTPPADLHERFSLALPVLVICELLGVPHGDRDRFRAWADASSHMWDGAAAADGHRQLAAYMGELVERKRAEPAEDVISDLVAHQAEDPTFSDHGLVQLCVGLLMAGYETTVARIDFGTLLLLTHPAQLARLRSDWSLLNGAVEEVLRMAAPTEGVILRYASTDVEAGGVTIRRGEMVLLSQDAANRDRLAFAEPERFDIARERNQHIAFGHGSHFCLGASLARVELQTALGSLLRRFPGLRLAAPVEELRLRLHSPLGGLVALPIAW